MALTPNEVTDDKGAVGNSWPTDDDDVISWVLDRKRKAEQRLQEWYEQAREDFAFHDNKQWSEEDKAKLESERRLAVTFNRIISTISSVCGQEVANRQEPRFLPRRVGEVDAADPMTDAVKWFREGCNAEDEDSDAFKDMTICGMGWTVTRMDYETNPDGEPQVERRDPTLMRWDPAARRKNLADKKWVESDYWMTKEAIEERWSEADLSTLVNLDAPEERDQPHDSTENWKYKNDASGFEYHQGQWRVIHHVERFTKPVYRALDPATGQIQEFSAAEFKTIKARMEELGLSLESTKGSKRVFWEAWTVGKIVLQSGEAKIQKDFQYQAMTCFRDRERGYWWGLVRPIIDPQRYANRMASLLMSILATGAKGGLIFETGAFVNPQKAKEDWARWDSAIEATDGAIAGQKFKAKDPVQLPEGAAKLLEYSISSIRDITGINLEVLGSTAKDQPGIVEDMRTKAGLTILAPVFDAKRLYLKRQAVILAEFVTRFLSDGRLIRIWGQQGQQFIPLVRRPDVVDYDVVIDESPASRDVKERTWGALREIVPGLTQMGIQPPPEVLDYAPLPESLAMAFKKAIAQKAQQPPQPSPEVQKAQAQMQAQIQIAQGKAQATQAAEQARMQADVQIEHDKAQVNLQLQAMKNQQEAHFQQMEMAQKAQLEILNTIIQQIGKVEVARVTSGADDGSGFVQQSGYPQ
jgi:hypothetical protein